MATRAGGDGLHGGGFQGSLRADLVLGALLLVVTLPAFPSVLQRPVVVAVAVPVAVSGRTGARAARATGRVVTGVLAWRHGGAPQRGDRASAARGGHTRRRHAEPSHG